MKNPILFFLFVSFANVGLSQWEPLNGPYGGWIYDLEQNQTYQFASSDHGLYRSSDKGITWEHLKIADLSVYTCWSIGIHQDQLVIHARSRSGGEHQNHLYRSEDNGNSWTMITRPDSAFFLTEIAINDYGIYLSWNYDLWVSTDEGQTWAYSSLDSVTDYFNDLFVYDGHIYVGAYKKYYKSSLNSDEWEEIEVDGMGESVHMINVFDSLILIREYQYGKLYRSADGGDTWTHSLDPNWGNGWTNFVKIDSNFYANHRGSLFRSEDEGKTWQQLHDDNYIGSIYKMISNDQTILAGTLSEGIFRSDNSGETFKVSNSGLDATNVNTIESDQDYLWTGCDYVGISRYQKSTSTWDTILLPAQYYLYDIQVLDGKIFALKDFGDVHRSEDNGASWTTIHLNEDFNEFTNLYTYANSILVGGKSDFSLSPLFISNDYGTTWRPDTFRIEGQIHWPSMFSRNSNFLFTANNENVYRSSDNGLTWHVLNTGLEFDSCWCSIKNLFAFDNIIFILFMDDYDSDPKLFSSRDQGETWELFEPGIEDEHFEGFSKIISLDNILLATGANSNYRSLFVSLDNGYSWDPFDEGLALDKINEITFDEDYLYAATSGQGVWRRSIQDLKTLSTNFLTQKEGIQIFPNPSNGNFTIKLDPWSPGNAKLSIADLSGKVCLSRQIALEFQTEVETENLSSGLYFLSVQTGDKFYTGKIVIQK